MIKVFLIANIIFFFALKSYSNDKVYVLKDDTLLSFLNRCDTFNTVFNKIINLTVDSRFIVIDSIKCKINSDNIDDYVFILSNSIQESNLTNTDCNLKYNKRLIAVFLSQNKKYKVLINQDIILNNIEYQSEPFRKIQSTKDGFKVSFYIGSRNRYYYDFYFKANKNGCLFLIHSDSRKNDIYVSGSGERKKIDYSMTRSTNFNNLNIRDFIKYF